MIFDTFKWETCQQIIMACDNDKVKYIVIQAG